MKKVQGINGGVNALAPRQITAGGREGLRIADLKGTPLYALAQNANVYGGATLSKTEMVFLQQQAKEMGFNPEKYGLEIVSEDLEGADFKETEKNAKNVSNFIKKSYEGQFGKKNNAVQTAQDAETRAYSIIKVAKDAFARNHNSDFVPENLGARPNFMDPQYKNNLTKYVSDLNAWAQDVAHAYQDADSMSNEQLAAMIMQNSDENSAFNAGVTVGVAEELMENVNKNTSEILAKEDETQQAVKEEGAATRRAVHAEGAATRKAVHTEGAATRKAVHAEGAATRSEVRRTGFEVSETVRDQGAKTRDEIQRESDRIIETLDPLYVKRSQKWLRDKAIAAGKSVSEFARENPELLIPGVGVPIWTARKLFE
mgnify:CR=1 FL=1